MALKITTIDRYIIRKFIGTFFFALALIIVIIIVFDISENIDDFVERKAPLYDIAFRYYMNFIPFIVNSFSPLFVFITVVFFTSKMAQHSEIIAILSGGMSFLRMMYPYFISAAFIWAISLLLNMVVIPPANAKRLDFEAHYLRKSTNRVFTRNMHYQVAPGTFMYIEMFNPWDNRADRFTLEQFEGAELKEKITADITRWDSTENAWVLTNYTRRVIHENGDSIIRGERKVLNLSVGIEDLKQYKDVTKTLNMFALNKYIEELKRRGDRSVKTALIEKNTRIAVPFSAFILSLIGVSLSSRKVRGGIGLKIGIGVALSFSYILFLRFSEMFVHGDTLPPEIALWMPNVIYSIVAVVLYIQAPK